MKNFLSFAMLQQALLYASIYNTGSLGLMLYLIHRKGDVALNASNPFDWMSIGQIDVFLIIVCVSTAIIFTVYAMMREDKDRTVWAFIAFILITIWVWDTPACILSVT